MNPEIGQPESVYEINPQKTRAEIQEEIERLEKELSEPTLKPDDIKVKKGELELYRKMYKEIN